MTEDEFRALKPGDSVVSDCGATQCVVLESWDGEVVETDIGPLRIAKFWNSSDAHEPQPPPAPTLGAHYARLGQYETKYVIRAWQESWPPEWRYFLGSMLKYISRLGAKPGQDVRVELRKALEFGQMALETELKSGK